VTAMKSIINWSVNQCVSQSLGQWVSEEKFLSMFR
jgi:hypothetical protein